jgi:hypothetical protein
VVWTQEHPFGRRPTGHSLHEPHLQLRRDPRPGAVHEAEDAGDVGPGLGIGRDAVARRHGARAGVVGGEGERDGAKPAQEVRNQVGLGVARLLGAEWILQA